MVLSCSQAVSRKSEASMAASAIRIIAALVASGELATSSCPRRACRRVEVLEIGRVGGDLVVGPSSLFGFLEQWEER